MLICGALAYHKITVMAQAQPPLQPVAVPLLRPTKNRTKEPSFITFVLYTL
jgi:hypothetical protein